MDDGYASEFDDVAVNRLEEFRLGLEEPDLSEEELKINDQLQGDELLALESIYGDNVVILNREKGLRCFQIRVHVEITNELTISVKIDSSHEDAESCGIAASSIASIGCSNELLSTFKVHYLPPIILTCLLPKSYPSHIPPLFTIYIKWLDCSRISTLCHMLDSIWMDEPRQEVMYQWVEWLHSSSLSYLGISSEISLGSYSTTDAGERRALSGCSSFDSDIPLIMNFNDVKCNQVFRESLHECFICFGEYAGMDFIRVPCKHFFCSKCLETYASMHVKEGSIDLLRCPDAKCRTPIPPDILKRLLKDEEFKRWELLLLQKTLDSMSDLVYCPRCETICIEDEDNNAQCPVCFLNFCSLCKEPRHIGRSCMTREERIALLEKRLSSSRIDFQQLRKIQEMKNEFLVLRNYMQFPSCKMAISRITGCNHMKCTYCGQFFCYRCGEAIDAGYSHFRRKGCEILPQNQTITWDQQQRQEREMVAQEALHEKRMIAQREAELVAVADHAHSCPVCRKFNARVEKNNHILCSSCQTHYCYLCRHVVRRSSEHYGPRGCKQHTE